MRTDAIRNVVALLGGHEQVAKMTGRHVSRVYVWVQSGSVPAKIQSALLAAASEKDIDLRPEDFFVPERLQSLLSEVKNAMAGADGAGNAIPAE